MGLRDERYTFNLAIPCLSIALLWLFRTEVFQHPQYSLQAAIPLALASLAAGLGRASSTVGTDLFWSILAVTLVWISAFVLVYGVEAARASLFAIVFLLLMAPLPPAFLAHAVAFLQSASAETTYGLFRLLHVPITREGAFQFALPGVTIEVAEECSGIRSALSLVISSLLAGRLGLHSAWARACFTLLAIPVAILKNAIRIVIISVLGVYVDRGYFNGNLHHSGGLLFALIAIAILVPIFLVLRRMEGPRSVPVQST